MGWIDEVIDKAIARRWCTDLLCTTCGADRFRRAVIAEAMRQAGIMRSADRRTPLRELVSDLEDDQRAAVFERVIEGLRDADATPMRVGAIRVVLFDLDPPLITWGVPAALSQRLAGTPAGEILEGMHAAAAESHARQAAYAAYESAEAVEERKRMRQAQTAERVEERRLQKEEKDRKRAELLRQLRALPRAERLRFIARLPSDFRLEAIPDELVPLDESAMSLDPGVRASLIRRIDRRRRGAWGALRKRLSPPAEP